MIRTDATAALIATAIVAVVLLSGVYLSLVAILSIVAHLWAAATIKGIIGATLVRIGLALAARLDVRLGR